MTPRTHVTGMRRALRVVTGFLVATLLLALLVAWVGPARVTGRVAAVDPAVYVLALAAGAGSLFAWTETNRRVFDLLTADAGERRFRRVYLAGVFVRSVVPGGTVGGTPLLAYVLSEGLDLPYERNLVTVGAAEFCNKTATVVVLAVGVAYLLVAPGRSHALAEVGLAMATVLTAGLLVAYAAVLRHDGGGDLVVRAAEAVRGPVARVSDRLATALAPGAVADRVERFATRVETVRSEPGVLFAALAFAHLGWLCYTLALYFSLVAVGAHVPYPALLFVGPVAGVAAVLSVPGGLGAVESATAGLLALVSTHDPGTLVAATLLFRIATFWLTVAAGGAAAAQLSLRDGFGVAGIEVG